MTQREEKAIKAFRSDFNCSQSVLTVYSDDLQIDNNLALGVSCGFGGGMGRLQETCGAVTGAFMAIGLFNSQKFTDNKDRKAKSYDMIQKFNKKFIEFHQTTNCRKLLNCDLSTKEGQDYAKIHNVHENICEKCILSSVQILEELFSN
jgi:C_GCAxxG_C_C family probable redox protein